MLVAFHQEAFLVHVGESPRAMHLGASVLLAPVRNGSDQGAQHFFVFDEVEPAETDDVLSVVGLVVDDGCHAAHDFIVSISQEAVSLAEVVGSVFLGVEGVVFVAFKGGHPIGAVFVQMQWKSHKLFQLLVTFHFFDANAHRLKELNVR